MFEMTWHKTNSKLVTTALTAHHILYAEADVIASNMMKY